MTHVRLAHLSGKWSVGWKRHRHTVSRYSHVNDLVTGTELVGRGEALARDGWTTCHTLGGGGLAECGLMARDRVWTVLEWEALELGPDLGPGGVVASILVALESVATGQRLVVAVVHLPSAVEGTWTERGARVRLWLSSALRLRRALRRWRRRHSTRRVIVVGDFNLASNLAWVRAVLRAAFPAMTLARGAGDKGTHGSRPIDYGLARGVGDFRQHVAPRGPGAPGDDHRPIELRGNLA